MAQTEQKKGRKSDSRVRFNVVDLVIIVAILACIAGIYLRYNFGEQYGVEHELGQYEITFEVQNVRYTSADAFSEGDAVYLKTQGKLLGTVLGIDSTTPSEMIYTDLSGNIRQVYYPENSRIDMVGRLLVSGTMTDRGFMLDGNTFLAPGAIYAVQTPRIDVSIVIAEISPLKAGN